jgi:hypothetical protein
MFGLPKRSQVTAGVPSMSSVNVPVPVVHPDDQRKPLSQHASDPRMPLGRSGKPFGKHALYGWAGVGVRGVRLRCTRVGNCLTCSWRDVEDFFTRLSEKDGLFQGGEEGPSETPRSARQRDRAASDAERELALMGVE